MHVQRVVMFEETAPFATDVYALNLYELRAAYSLLFDRTAQEVFRRGLDLDDVVVERFLIVSKPGGTSLRVELPSLADRSVVQRCVMGAAGTDCDAPGETSTPSILEIGTVVIRDDPCSD